MQFAGAGAIVAAIFVRSDSGQVKYAESVLYLHFNAGAVTHSVDNSAEPATNEFSPHIEHR
jgi:hypothetical protein